MGNVKETIRRTRDVRRSAGRIRNDDTRQTVHPALTLGESEWLAGVSLANFERNGVSRRHRRGIEQKNELVRAVVETGETDEDSRNRSDYCGFFKTTRAVVMWHPRRRWDIDRPSPGRRPRRRVRLVADLR